MQIKRLLKKVVEPALIQCGYVLEILGASDYCFLKQDDSRAVSIDTARYLPKELRITYQVRGGPYFRLGLRDFSPQFCPLASVICYKQEELEPYLREFVTTSQKIIFPYLDDMAENFVESTYQMSVKLSQNTSDRVDRFTKKWALSRTPCLENLIQLDNILDSMKTTPANRRSEFFYNEQEIYDLSAYYGELKATSGHMPGQWMWREINKGQPVFVIKASGYDPLARVIHAWNFGTEVTRYSLQVT